MQTKYNTRTHEHAHLHTFGQTLLPDIFPRTWVVSKSWSNVYTVVYTLYGFDPNIPPPQTHFGLCVHDIPRYCHIGSQFHAFFFQDVHEGRVARWSGNHLHPKRDGQAHQVKNHSHRDNGEAAPPHQPLQRQSHCSSQ